MYKDHNVQFLARDVIYIHLALMLTSYVSVRLSVCDGSALVHYS